MFEIKNLLELNLVVGGSSQGGMVIIGDIGSISSSEEVGAPAMPMTFWQLPWFPPSWTNRIASIFRRRKTGSEGKED